MCVLTYTPQKSLRPDTVVAQNFTVETDEKQIDVLETVYYPFENTLKLVLEDDVVNESVSYTSEGVLDVDGNSCDVSGETYAYNEQEAEYDALSITGMNFFRDGKPVDNLINSINADIKLMITNSGKEDFTDVSLTMTDGNGELVARESFDIGAYSNCVLWLNVRGFTFTNNDFTFNIK